MGTAGAKDLAQYDRFLLRKRLCIIIAAIAAIMAAVASLGIGVMRIPLPDILRALTGTGEPKYITAIMNIRLPRAATACLVGGILASSGAVMQCVLRNPLASASTLGVSQGASFGAAIGIIVFGGGTMTSSSTAVLVSVNNPYIVSICAFVCGSLSSLVVILISRLKRNVGPGGMILAGTALAAMFSGGSTLLQYFADDTSLGAVVFWTFGNLGSTGWSEILFLAVVMVAVLIFFMANRWNYNAMEAGADTAQSLGVNTRLMLLAGMGVCSFAAAAAVSFVGIIGFVGLIAPHIMRRFVGTDYRYLIPGSAFCGALLLLTADIAAKTIASPIILPIGALMSFVGGPVFLVMLFRGKSYNG